MRWTPGLVNSEAPSRLSKASLVGGSAPHHPLEAEVDRHPDGPHRDPRDLCREPQPAQGLRGRGDPLRRQSQRRVQRLRGDPVRPGPRAHVCRADPERERRRPRRRGAAGRRDGRRAARADVLQPDLRYAAPRRLRRGRQSGGGGRPGQHLRADLRRVRGCRAVDGDERRGLGRRPGAASGRARPAPAHPLRGGHVRLRALPGRRARAPARPARHAPRQRGRPRARAGRPHARARPEHRAPPALQEPRAALPGGLPRPADEHRVPLAPGAALERRRRERCGGRGQVHVLPRARARDGGAGPPRPGHRGRPPPAGAGADVRALRSGAQGLHALSRARLALRGGRPRDPGPERLPHARGRRPAEPLDAPAPRLAPAPARRGLRNGPTS